MQLFQKSDHPPDFPIMELIVPSIRRRIKPWFIRISIFVGVMLWSAIFPFEILNATQSITGMAIVVHVDFNSE
jgi:hypothetical protein